MLYVNEDTKHIIIPSHHSKALAPYRIIITNNLTQERYLLEVENESENPFFYKFSISFKGFSDGEYKYEVNGDTGLLTCGDFNSKPVSYNTDINTIQYDPEK